MSDQEEMEKILICCVIAVAIIIAVSIGFASGETKKEHEAVDAGVAEYSVDNRGHSSFHWKTKPTKTNLSK